MLKYLSKHQSAIITCSIIAVALLAPSSAYAVANLTDFMGKIGTTLTNGKALVAQFFYFMGVVLWGVGILLFRKESKEEGRGHMKNGFISIGVGTALLIFPTLINWTVAETDAEQTTNSTTKSTW